MGMEIILNFEKLKDLYNNNFKKPRDKSHYHQAWIITTVLPDGDLDKTLFGTLKNHGQNQKFLFH